MQITDNIIKLMLNAVASLRQRLKTKTNVTHLYSQNFHHLHNSFEDYKKILCEQRQVSCSFTRALFFQFFRTFVNLMRRGGFYAY